MNPLKQLEPQLKNVQVHCTDKYKHWFSRIRMYLDGFFDFLYNTGVEEYKTDVDRLKLILNSRIVDGLTQPIETRLLMVVQKILQFSEDKKFAALLRSWNKATACYILSPDG